MKKNLSVLFLLFTLFTVAKAQQNAEVTITLNEKFFDVLLDAVFTNLQNPSFPLSELQDSKELNQKDVLAFTKNGGNSSYKEFQILKTDFDSTEKNKNFSHNSPVRCDESIRLMREIEGVRTAVQFRNGKISAPIAFNGSYNPPLIGCINFQGWADSTIELEFDQNSQTLIGKAKVSAVRLSGTGGVGSSLIARLVQSSIDKRINPIQILQMEKVSFVVPVQNSGSLKMKAVEIRHEIVNGALNVNIVYQFLKG